MNESQHTGFDTADITTRLDATTNWAVVTIRSGSVRSEASFNGDVLPMSRNRAVADTFDPEQVDKERESTAH